MKNIARLGSIMVAATLLSLPAHAFTITPNGGGVNSGNAGANGGLNGGRAVPEIDVAGATLGFALLGGIVAIVRERRRRGR